MSLFCAAIRRDSVSFLSFSFSNNVRFFSFEISPTWRLKNPHSFSSYFCFLQIIVLSVLILSVLSLLTVNSLLCWRINAVFNSGESSSSFSLGTSYLSDVGPGASTWTFLSYNFAWTLTSSILRVVPIIVLEGLHKYLFRCFEKVPRSSDL